MKRLLPTTLYLSLASMTFLQCSNPAPLKVMSYNIRYDNPGDGINTWSKRKDRVFDLITREQPDVVGLQEALHGQVGDLASNLTGYGWYGVGRDDGQERGEYVPIFYRKDRMTLVDSGTFWISPTPDQPGSIGWDAAITRIASWVRLLDRASRKEIFFFNAHFDHRGAESRRLGALLLRRQIKHIAQNHWVVVTGDLNFPPESMAYGNLTQADDSTADLATLFDAARRADGAAGGGQGTCCGFAVDQDHSRRIDYVLSTAPFNVVDYRVLTVQYNGYYPSDHLPVVVVFSPKS